MEKVKEGHKGGVKEEWLKAWKVTRLDKAHWVMLVERQQGDKVKGNKRKDGRVWGLGSGSEVEGR